MKFVLVKLGVSPILCAIFLVEEFFVCNCGLMCRVLLCEVVEKSSG